MTDINAIDKHMCTGCAACANVCPVNAIKMMENEDGFLYPVINSNVCVKCGLCFKRCPINETKYDNFENPLCYAVIADENILKVSSSGGAFSVLADYVLNNGGYICGAAYGDTPTTVKHVIVNRKEDLSALRGSKYIQSEIGLCYREIKDKLEDNAFVLFTGCPCQVAGLKNYLGKKYDNLITIDLICHGVPSHKLLEKFINDLPNKNDLLSVAFRNKDRYGWGHSLQVKYIKGEEYFKPAWECEYYNIFLKGLAWRESCGNCQFNKLPRQGDFTIGDYWGVRKEFPSIDAQNGVSILLLNTDKAKEMFEKVKSKLAFWQETDLEISRKYNMNIFRSSVASKNRDRFLKLLRKYSFSEAYRRLMYPIYEVGIVGWWYGKNYGSALTYYALHEVIEDLGYDTLMLDWPVKKKYPFPESNIRQFAKNHYKISQQYTYDSYSKLNNHIEQFLVGSDQLWNYWDYIRVENNYYMLGFVRDDRKKLSYATSFGHPEYNAPKELIAQQAKLLKTFDAVSVREEDGVKICKEKFDVQATQVLDPVFLCPIEKYLKIINDKKKYFDRPYLLAYILSPTKEKGILLKDMAAKLGLELCIILDGQKNLEENKKLLGIDNVMSVVGVEDWLTLIYYSDFVITDSFHGCCFSIIFEKQFICLLNKRRGISRFNTLLGRLNLMDFAVDRIEEIFEKNIIGKKIDYDKVNIILEKEKERSIKWLSTALAKEKVAIKTAKQDTAENKIINKKYDVGIVGFWSANNFGSVITYFALKKVIEKMGFTVGMIELPSEFNDTLGDMMSRRFVKKHYATTKVISKKYYGEWNKYFDTFIVGSDQVWNPNFIKSYSCYMFLDFVDDSKKKIAYAASIGKDHYNLSYDDLKNVSYHLNRFDYVSVREDRAVQTCKEDLSYNDAVHVLDPVWLCTMEDYDNIIKDATFHSDEDFVFSYILDPTVEKKKALEYAVNKIGIKHYNIRDIRQKYGEGDIVIENTLNDPSMEDWMYCLKNCKFVITDSHHGIVFAMIFNKPFICFANPNRTMSRFTSLFNLLGINDRLIYNPLDIQKDDFYFSMPDYLKINKIVENEKEKSFNWFDKALRSEKEKKVASDFDILYPKIKNIGDISWKQGEIIKKLQSEIQELRTLLEKALK